MKKLFVATVSILALTSFTLAEDAPEPKELKDLKTAYQNQVKTALDPINRKYLQQLDTLKKQLGGKGDIKGATAVQAELDRISGGATDANVNATADAPGKAGVKNVVEIPATYEGVSIGSVKKGQKVTLKYIKGEISEDVARFPKSNPDDPKSSRDVGIVIVENVNGAHAVIQQLPRGTAKRPFSYKFTKDYDDVVLMIAEAITSKGAYVGNDGSAEFEVTIGN